MGRGKAYDLFPCPRMLTPAVNRTLTRSLLMTVLWLDLLPESLPFGGVRVRHILLRLIPKSNAFRNKLRSLTLYLYNLIKCTGGTTYTVLLDILSTKTLVIVSDLLHPK